MSKPKAVLFGPFVGELYWECGRFAPILSHMVSNSSPKDKNIKYIVLTREDRFDLYGTYADILIPLKIPDDYSGKIQPDCFRLQGIKKGLYQEIIELYRKKYEKQYKIIRHIYPKINGNIFANKNQFSGEKMRYEVSPRKTNYKLVKEYIKSDKPLVVLAPRFRKGYRRNWPRWPEFYNMIYKDKFLMDNFQFIICGKPGECIKDSEDRFLDMTKIQLEEGSSLIGILLAIMERAILTVGSQSAIPNIALLYKVQVLEFGNQRNLHTKTYNHFNTPVKFINSTKFNVEPKEFFNHMRQILKKKEIK